MAKHGQFTYMARIKSDVICGGALITWRHVLTAAHCIVTTPSTTRTVIKPKARFRIHLGDHSKKKKDHNEEIRRVRQLVPHPTAWQNGQWVNDIGVIILQRAVSRFNPYIKPLWPNFCFVKQKPQNREDVTLTGWGYRQHPRKNENGASPTFPPDKLRVFETSIAVCNNHTNTNFKDEFVCAFEKGRDVGFCQGDSGG